MDAIRSTCSAGLEMGAGWLEPVPPAATGVSGSSYGTLRVFPNFATQDRYDTSVEWYPFYGSVILIDVSASWCGPGQALAEDADEMWTDHREDDEAILAVIADYTGSGVANLRFLGQWADAFGLTFPVLGQGDISTVYDAGLKRGQHPPHGPPRHGPEAPGGVRRWWKRVGDGPRHRGAPASEVSVPPRRG